MKNRNKKIDIKDFDERIKNLFNEAKEELSEDSFYCLVDIIQEYIDKKELER